MKVDHFSHAALWHRVFRIFGIAAVILLVAGLLLSPTTATANPDHSAGDYFMFAKAAAVGVTSDPKANETTCNSSNDKQADVSGSNSDFYGRLHSNADIAISGSNNDFFDTSSPNPEITFGTHTGNCQSQADGGNNYASGGPTDINTLAYQVDATTGWPGNLGNFLNTDRMTFGNDVTQVLGPSAVCDRGNLSSGSGTNITITSADNGSVICNGTGSIVLSVSGLGSTSNPFRITMISHGLIDISGSNHFLAPAAHGILAWTDQPFGSNATSIKLAGSNINVTSRAILFTPRSGQDVSGSNQATLCIQMIGQGSLKVAGSNSTFGPLGPECGGDATPTHTPTPTDTHTPTPTDTHTPTPTDTHTPTPTDTHTPTPTDTHTPTPTDTHTPTPTDTHTPTPTDTHTPTPTDTHTPTPTDTHTPTPTDTHTPTPTVTPVLSEGCLGGAKFYDTNHNGDWDAGEPGIAGWEIYVWNGSTTEVDTTDANGKWEVCFTHPTSLAGTYHVAEGITPISSGWVQTSPDEQADYQGTNTANTSVTINVPMMRYVVEVGEGGFLVTGLDFGNNCQVTPGGRTMGFWSNKNGQALITQANITALNNFYLANGNGADTNFAGSLAQQKTAYRNWLLSAKATNMAYMLSAQMSATYLNTQHGFTNGNAIVTNSCGTFAGADNVCSVNELIQYAQWLITQNPSCLSNCSARAEQEQVKNLFDLINNGGTIILPPGTCPVPNAFNDPFA